MSLNRGNHLFKAILLNKSHLFDSAKCALVVLNSNQSTRTYLTTNQDGLKSLKLNKTDKVY